MKKTIMLLALTASSVLSAAHAFSVDACILPVETQDLTKTLQESLRIHHDLSRELIELQTLNSSIGGSTNEKNAADLIQSIVTRVGDAKSNLQDAFSRLDNTQDIPLILAQAQGRLVAALGKFRGFKNLKLDDSKRDQINCSEMRLQDINLRLKEILKEPI